MSEHFVVFLSAQTGSVPHRRLHFANRLANPPTDTSFTVLDAAVMPLSQRTVAVIFAKASDLKTLSNAFAEAEDTFAAEIHPIQEFSHDASVTSIDYCLFADPDYDGFVDITTTGMTPANVRTQAILEPGGPVRHIQVIQATHPLAAEVALGKTSQASVVSQLAMLPKTFVKHAFSDQAQIKSTAQPLTSGAFAGTQFDLINGGTAPMYVSSIGASTNAYWTAQRTKGPLAAGSNSETDTPVFLWKTVPGTFQWVINPIMNWHPLAPPNSLSTIYCPPTTRIAAAPGSTYEVDLENGTSINPQTDMSRRIDAIVNTSQFDATWPEDGYTEGSNEYLAYKYILSKIPGNVPPKEGTVKPGIVNAISYPADADFPESVFNKVKEHLGQEATFFQYAQQWFGPDGLLTLMNTQISLVATDSLISTSALMEIQHDSLLEMILESIFNDIIALIGAIPAVGPAIAAILKVAMNTTILVIKTSGGSTTIKATEAELAQALEEILQNLDNATAKQLADISGNWGKLSMFAESVIDKTISAEKIGAILPTPGSGSDIGAVKEELTKASLPQGYITTLGKAWEVSFFKSMYRIRFTPLNAMNPTQTENAPDTWDPANGNYNFYYSLPATLVNSSGDKSTWFLSFGCSPQATAEVMERLFNPDQLNVDPISFFLGLDGWQYVMPVGIKAGANLFGNLSIVSIP